MPYAIILSNGSVLTNVADNTVDNTTSLTLVGRNYPGYGGLIANDLVHLLENAANSAPPGSPLIGQLWWDTVNGLMKVWTGKTWFALTTGVSSILGNSGAITFSQLTAAGLAPINSPALTGLPTAPTAASGTSSNQIATCGYVINQLNQVVGGVSAVVGNTGAVTLAQMVSGGLAPLGSPNFSGIPTAPTPNTGTNNNQIATCAYVINEVGSLSTGVSSVAGITGNVTIDQLVLAGLTPKTGAQFSGLCTAPTPAQGTNTNQLATTAFVAAALSSSTPATRIKATGTVNVYVSPSGNDTTGTGSQSLPYATMQAAYNYIANNYDGAGNALFIFLMPGTHTSPLAIGGNALGFSRITVTGTSGQGLPGQANYLSSSTILSVSNATAIQVTDNAVLTVQGFTVSASGGSSLSQQSGTCLSAAYGGSILIGAGMIFGASGGYHLSAQAGANIICSSSYTITGSALGHILSAESSNVTISGTVSGATVTISGTPSFTTFATVLANAYLGIVGVTFTGTCTGSQFSVSSGGVLSVNGAGLNYLPGTLAGSGNALTYGGGFYG